MPASHIDFIVEELSMEQFLEPLLKNFLRPQGCTYTIHSHKGKLALLERLESRLKGYSSFLPPDHRIVVIVDRDTDSCHELKDKLESACSKAGLLSKNKASTPHWQVVNRIAIEELEAWYFGNWEAVRKAFPRLPENIPRKAPYRKPDDIKGGTWEAFERILNEQGYYKQGLNKLQAAATIGNHINPEDNLSPSFQSFWQAIMEAVR